MLLSCLQQRKSRDPSEPVPPEQVASSTLRLHSGLPRSTWCSSPAARATGDGRSPVSAAARSLPNVPGAFPARRTSLCLEPNCSMVLPDAPCHQLACHMSLWAEIMQTAISAEEGLQCKEAAEAVQRRTLLLGGWGGRRRKGSCQHLLPFLVFLAEAGYDSRARCCLCWIICCERHLHSVKEAAGLPMPHSITLKVNLQYRLCCNSMHACSREIYTRP